MMKGWPEANVEVGLSRFMWQTRGTARSSVARNQQPMLERELGRRESATQAGKTSMSMTQMGKNVEGGSVDRVGNNHRSNWRCFLRLEWTEGNDGVKGRPGKGISGGVTSGKGIAAYRD